MIRHGFRKTFSLQAGIARADGENRPMQETRKLQVHYPLSMVNEPVVTRLVTEFDLTPNLVRADIDAAQGGWIVMELGGEPTQLDSGIAWMRERGLVVTETS
jgi:hypothetical protein